MKKILIIADLETWILGEIARQLQLILSKQMQVNILYSHNTNFIKHFMIISHNSDVIHFLSPWDFFEFAKLIDKPCVVMLWHMVDWTIFKQFTHRIDTLCVGSQQWLEIAKDYLPSSTSLKRVHYGLDISKFQKQSKAKENFLSCHNLSPNTLVFGFAGSAWSNESNRKGLDRFFNCFLHIKEKFKYPFVIRIIGRHWTSDIIPCELKSVTQFELDLPTSQLPNFYSSLDYYLCTSRYEGVPYPDLEAMSCETVVISTPVGVVPEIIQNNQNGFILSEKTIIDDFIAFIQTTAEDYTLREKCGVLARQTIINHFNWKTSVNYQEYEEIYNLAINFFNNRSNSDIAMIKLKSLYYNYIYRFISKIKLRSRIKALYHTIFMK